MVFISSVFLIKFIGNGRKYFYDIISAVILVEITLSSIMVLSLVALNRTPKHYIRNTSQRQVIIEWKIEGKRGIERKKKY